MSEVVCPGSFDPFTAGHLDIVRRAAAAFDRVVVAVLDNPAKQPTFTVEERIELIEAETSALDNVEVDRFSGLLVTFCEQRAIGLVVKGVRGAGDLESEMSMAQINRRVGGVETLLMPASPEHGHLSSTLIKQLARGGAPLQGAVPPGVEAALRARLAADPPQDT